MNGKNLTVIGTGYWGKNLGRNFHQLGVLKAVCDGDPGILTRMSETYPGLEATDDPDAVLNDPGTRVVIIAVPAALHSGLAEKALNAGKHVFVETPLSLNFADGAKLVRLAAQRCPACGVSVGDLPSHD